MVSNSTKRDKEEVDKLNREMAKLKAEHETKQNKQKMQIDRLTKQNNELKAKNKELQDDLRSMD